jgi:hypothetical protein
LICLNIESAANEPVKGCELHRTATIRIRSRVGPPVSDTKSGQHGGFRLKTEPALITEGLLILLLEFQPRASGQD